MIPFCTNRTSCRLGRYFWCELTPRQSCKNCRYHLPQLHLQTENNNLRENATVLLTCLYCLHSTTLLISNGQQIYLLGQIQTKQEVSHTEILPPLGVLCCNVHFKNDLQRSVHAQISISFSYSTTTTICCSIG